MKRLFGRRAVLVSLVAAAFASAASIILALTTDLSLVSTLHEAHGEHVEQAELLALVTGGKDHEAFEHAFEVGDEFFETEFNAVDGGGANVGDGSRFTRTPRADLKGLGQWASHQPPRKTGPNALACNSCHIQLFDDGAGSAVGNVHRDPLHSGVLGKFIQRNTPHVFAPGAVQRLAEEMTAELFRIRDGVASQACAFGSAAAALSAKGIGFGRLAATRTSRGGACQVSYDTSRVAGVSGDLIVRPFQWKGSVASLRDFNRDAAHNEIGIQAVEFAGDNLDGDGDGVANEATVGDMTALTVYLAAQPRPTTSLELERLGLIDPLSPAERARIIGGQAVFHAVGCAGCHVPRLLLNDPIFREPSAMKEYRDTQFPAGQDPIAMGLDPRFPVKFDLTADQPDNRITDPSGNVVRLGSFVRDSRGRAMIELYGDLKRHNLGSRLAESIDEVGTGAATFLTENLWGVASTAPYLHDGRATTLTEAILEHGGEAAASRTAFLRQSSSAQHALIAFLNNLVLFKLEEEGVVVPPPEPTTLSRSLQMRRPRAR
jgi:cytochrome c peroxidase